MKCERGKRALTASGVNFFYGDRHILKDIDLVLDQGEFLGIAGPNGGGKTTLLKLLLGLLRPQSGCIELMGSDPRYHRHGVGYVGQTSAGKVPFPLSLLEVVLMGRLKGNLWGFRYNADDVSAAEQALESVDLHSLAKLPFCNLSGGQKQRGLIARSLCGDAQVLVLDEPTAHIDPESQKRILALLEDLKGTMAIVMVSHDWPAMAKCSDRILYVHQSAAAMAKETICDHFALGLYHFPQKAGEL